MRPQASNFIKKRLWHRCFPVNFVKVLKTGFYTENFWTTASKDTKIMMLFVEVRAGFT